MTLERIVSHLILRVKPIGRIMVCELKSLPKPPPRTGKKRPNIDTWKGERRGEKMKLGVSSSDGNYETFLGWQLSAISEINDGLI